MPTIAIVEYCRLRYACAPSRTAAEISCILALPASAVITDWIAQIAKAIASAPHRTMIHKAVIEFPRLLPAKRRPVRRNGTLTGSTLGGRPPQIGADIAELTAKPVQIPFLFQAFTACATRRIPTPDQNPRMDTCGQPRVFSPRNSTCRYGRRSFLSLSLAGR